MRISKRCCDICGKELNFKETSITKLILDTCEHPSPQSFPPLNYDLCWECSSALYDHIINMKKVKK